MKNISVHRFRQAVSGIVPPLLAALALVALLPSCRKDYFDLDEIEKPVWNPHLAVPLIDSKMSAEELSDRLKKDEETLIIYPDGLMGLLLENSVYSLSAEDLLRLDDQSGHTDLSLTEPEIEDVEANGFVDITEQVVVPLKLNSTSKLRLVEFKGGSLDMSIQSELPYEANVTMSIPSLTLNGQPYSRSFTVGSRGTETFSIPLDGYQLDLTAGNFNSFLVTLQIRFNDNPVERAATTHDMFLRGTMSQMRFRYMEGDLGQQVLDLPADTTPSDLFSSLGDGKIWWEDPRVRVVYTNSLGAAIGLEVEHLNLYNPQTGLTPVQGFPKNPVIPAAPARGAIAKRVDSITTSTPNSNVRDVVSNKFDFVLHNLKATTNPSGDPANNFVMDTSRVDLDLELELPFHGRAANFSRQDTAEFKVADLLAEGKEVEWVKLRFILDNGFPAELRGQVYFLDSNNVIVDSLVANPMDYILKSAPIDAQGLVTGTTRKITDYTLDRKKLEEMDKKGVTQILGVAILETTNQGNTIIKIYKHYTIGLHVSMEAKIRYSFE